LVESLEEGVALGDLRLTEVFIFTDNTSAEGGFYKGNSPSRTLFSLILRLRLLEMSGQLRIHMIHVAGSHMIDQGTDSLSRGDYVSGVMAGQSILSFIPLHESALDHQVALLPWIRTWFPDPGVQPLTPEGWYTTGQGWGADAYTSEGYWYPVPSTTPAYLWAPAPAAASAAVDALALSRFKRPSLLHVFLCPRLMTHLWRKKLFKVADVVLDLLPRPCAVWPACMHEPLLLAFVFPILSCPTWHLRTSAPVWANTSGLFCSNFVHCRPPWPACRQVWCGPCYTQHPQDKFYQSTPIDESGFDWRPRDGLLRFKEARSGDHLLIPFQCDLCSFRNLCLRNPQEHDPHDTFLLCCIRRANLDSVWGRESHTVKATLRNAQQLVSMWRLARVPIELPHRGHFPVRDVLGLRVTIGMLIKSLEPGRYSKTYQQFETIRKLRAAYANMHMSSVEGVDSLRTVGGETAKMSLTLLPTNSLWFERFAQGCLKRMGQDVRQDWAVTLPTIHNLLETLDD